MTTTNYLKTALLLGAMTGLILLCGAFDTCDITKSGEVSISSLIDDQS